jgi:23S rRNA pseudouridine2605 synthase
VERLQKVLARAGVASRRASEELILAGRVRVNGRIVTELGTKVDAHKDRVEVDGKRLVAEKPVYYLIHKPREMVTTLDDPEGRATIADVLGRIPERVVPVGRLDYHTSGALLATNDGDMVDALLRPVAGVPKIYAVKFQGHLDVEELDALRNGVKLDDGYRTESHMGPAHAHRGQEPADSAHGRRDSSPRHALGASVFRGHQHRGPEARRVPRAQSG